MSDVVWTADQEAAIAARDAKILVNAAAGSGKTAVLTSRIIKRLIPDNNEKPVRADRLLVVTFTRAAAGEMRERIENGLKNELIKATECSDMKKRRFISNQIKQLSGAKISTIDSFCQSIAREYFHILNISPSFQIIQKSEERLMREEVFASLSDRLYKEQNKSFLLLAEGYARSGREDAILALVEKLYDFTANMPYPEEFINDAAEQYSLKSDFFDTGWAKKMDEDVKEILGVYSRMYDRLLKDYKDKEDLNVLLKEEKETIEKLISMSFSEKSIELGNYTCSKTEQEQDNTLFLRKNIEDNVKELCNGIFENISQLEDALVSMYYPRARALADVTLEFKRALDETKRKKSVLSFSDIERMTYQLLNENEGIKEEIKARFDEILIDEYQDTNALQDGIFEMITDGKNLFMVGDMKQSVYRFRGSEPLVFRSKSDTYTEKAEAPERKITLSMNFRSRTEVLDSVNDIFEKCMSRIVGEIEYDKTQKLNPGNDDYKDTGFDYKSEFVMIEEDKSQENAPDRAELEAEYIARRILDMKNSGFLVRDKVKVITDGVEEVTDSVRPICNSDVLILMSSHKSDGKIFRSTLAKYGIDCYCENEGFFVQPEIKLMMSLLRVIENPQVDIPMVAVMRSVVGGFTDDEIALIRAFEGKKSFFDALCSVYSKYLLIRGDSKETEASKLFGEKIIAFVERINMWRDKSRYLSAERMVNMLYEQTGIFTFFCAADSGQAKANLQLFFDRAKQYESSGYRGLFAFLKHMEKLEKTGEDLEGAGFSAGGDYVRIMTIHKSKGLEVPVVFLAGAGKKFNMKDKDGMLVLHNRLGFSLDYVDYNENMHVSSILKDMFAATIKKELLSEEMRKLYVALTRAKEKVIVTAHLEKNSKTQEKLENWQKMDELSIMTEASEAIGFKDWLAPVSMISDNWSFEYIDNLEIADVSTNETKVSEIKLPEKEEAISILSYTYPYQAVGIKSKAAVSDFKGIKKNDLPEKPVFMSDKRMGGAEFGTAVHKIMETLPIEHGNDRAYVERHIASLIEAGFITGEVANKLNADKILGFYESELGKRLMSAEKVYQESEFEISTKAARLSGDSSLDDEEFLLQGVIDCWFVEDDEIVLIDYKTDRVDDIDEIHQKYDIQLELYAEALEKMTKKRVKEKFIYLFSMDCVVQC